MAAHVELTPARVDAQPEVETVVSLSVTNTGRVVDAFTVRILGPAAAWTRCEPDQLRVFPGQSESARLVFAPPLGAATPAGPTPYGIQVAWLDEPAGAVVVEGVVDVAAVPMVGAAIAPRTVKARGGATAKQQVAVDNLGNCPVLVGVRGGDDSDEVVVTTEPPQAVIAVGAAAFFTVRSRGTDAFLRGPDKTLPFHVEVATPNAAPIRLPVKLYHRAQIASWLPKAVLIAAVLVAAGTALYLGVLRGKPTVPVSQGSPSPSSSPSPSPSASTSSVPANWSDSATFPVQADMPCGAVMTSQKQVGTITGGPVPDAVIAQTCAPASGKPITSVYVYSDKTGTPTLDSPPLIRQSDQLQATAIMVNGPTVTLTLSGWSAAAPDDHPDLAYTQTFTFSGGSFQKGALTNVLHACGDTTFLPPTSTPPDSAASTTRITLHLKSQLTQPCTISGFPTVQVLDAGGAVLGTAQSSSDLQGTGAPSTDAPSTDTPTPPQLTVDNGQSVSAVLQWSIIDSGGATCTPGASLDITIPGGTQPAHLTVPVATCSLVVSPLLAGELPG